MAKMDARFSLEDLAEKANAWCEQRGLAPANGQSARALSERTLRYYRTLGLLDGAERGGGDGYGEKHFYQLVAIRLLQAQGLPLGRVQTLLYGRDIDELRSIADAAPAALPDPFLPRPSDARTPKPCPSYALGGGFVLVSGEGRAVPREVLCAIAELLSGEGAADSNSPAQPATTRTHKRP
jgi:DNA-binding transcriptional MerR regulator